MKVFDSEVNDMIDVLIIKIDGDMNVFYDVDDEYVEKFVDSNLRNIGEFEKKHINVFYEYITVNDEMEFEDDIDGLIDNVYDEYYYETDEGDSYFRIVR